MRLFWIVPTFVLFLSGCTGTWTMDFAIPAPEARPVTAVNKTISLNLSVSDKRLRRGNIGSTNANNNKTYTVLTQPELDKALEAGIKNEIKARGMTLADGGPAFLLVDITQADSQTRILMFNVDVAVQTTLSVQVLDAGGRQYYQRNFARNESGKGDGFTLETVEQGGFRMEKVLAELIREMFDDDQLVQALATASRH